VKKLRFVVSLPNDNSYQHEQAAAAQETALRLGAEVEVLHAGNDAVTQSRQVLEIVQSRSTTRPDAILLEPLTTTGLVRAAEAAVSAGMGWVILNSDVDYLDRLRTNSKVPVFSVTRDHTEIGRIQGRQFAALLPGGGSVLYVQGPANNSAAVQRTIGLESVKPANIQIKGLRSSWEEASAYQAVNSWLRLSTNRAISIGLVGCQYDGIAQGARRAFEELPDRAERERWLNLPFTGVDGLPKQRKSLGGSRHSCRYGDFADHYRGRYPDARPRHRQRIAATASHLNRFGFLSCPRTTGHESEKSNSREMKHSSLPDYSNFRPSLASFDAFSTMRFT
jgi:ribose transport system substrate-binding protein